MIVLVASKLEGSFVGYVLWLYDFRIYIACCQQCKYKVKLLCTFFTTMPIKIQRKTLVSHKTHPCQKLIAWTLVYCDSKNSLQHSLVFRPFENTTHPHVHISLDGCPVAMRHIVPIRSFLSSTSSTFPYISHSNTNSHTHRPRTDPWWPRGDDRKQLIKPHPSTFTQTKAP